VVERIPVFKEKTAPGAYYNSPALDGSRPESDVVSEIERYIVMPGQACAYKVGMIKIQELRARAESTLGNHFDIRSFHSLILKNGAMPLSVLDEVVQSWIDDESAKISESQQRLQSEEKI
jgi:uncharacterized protein (DUF885 family)